MDIRFNQRAVRIRRPSTEGKPGPITVTAADGTGTTTAYEFDRLVFACGPRSTVSALGPAITEVERGLFSEFRSVDYYTLVVSAADLPTETSLTVIPKHCVSRETGAGHIVGIFCSHPGVGTYIVYAYGAAGLSPEDVARTVREDIAKMGGTMTELHFQERWEYMPHVTPLAMSRGFFSAFESIQGLHGCYHTGGLMDFEETEQCAKYGKNLVERFFPAPGAEPAVLAAAANLPPGVSREAAAEGAKFGINRWVRRGSVGLDPDVRNWAAVMHRAAMRYPQKEDAELKTVEGLFNNGEFCGGFMGRRIPAARDALRFGLSPIPPFSPTILIAGAVTHGPRKICKVVIMFPSWGTT
ncbi:MAG: hypothetical protein BJ554DRAFT_1272 [Olpidium bornovanus]|uniref:FAD/NAD(P)-binding domain-containing protein n=1 Tax=Olpidium bornovanus TaxID=278681 RepID=A0A8H7ZSA4_9FUNG|nr:MAG: hypothetical protein BJ554DRAFT_1272 [Olpidium bornovanus]